VVEVEIKDFSFSSDTLRIEPGTSVRWVNRDQVGHTSTADGGEWESPLLGPGESFVQRFAEEGSYPYYCTPHPFMRGVVIVES
jgi:plastocyanin